MKLNILETHDRLLEFKKSQTQNIFQGAEDCLKKNPDSLFFQSRSPYVYIFAHPRTLGFDEKIAKFNQDFHQNLTNPNYIRKYETMGDVEEKKMIWQPRLGKPNAQTNSYLFRAKSNSDLIEIIWLLPPEETWNQYKKDNVTENKDVIVSIDNFMHRRDRLNASHPEDLPLNEQRFIWKELIALKRENKMMKRLYGMSESE